MYLGTRYLPLIAAKRKHCFICPDVFNIHIFMVVSQQRGMLFVEYAKALVSRCHFSCPVPIRNVMVSSSSDGFFFPTVGGVLPATVYTVPKPLLFVFFDFG